MASNIRTFSITQARMGEPLQFQPALGSKELEELIDAYVMGSASKQDKLSEVTLEFFNLAQVDIYTGLLTRHYSVAVSPNWSHLAFEQSPTQSQSSGFSPPIFTPSPASSMTFADSGYGSISMTPPTRTMGAAHRVTKKAKKDTKKTAEVRLPGFSIMTKDGVDVTSSAGRGTKTKEQREHAHLMRIMKACDECKRKKVRCDPSHRRPHTDMSRSSTSTTSPAHPKPSPPISVPSLSRATTQTSPDLPSFGNAAIDDFVLFPEDNASSWNPADMSLPEFDENLDLSQFNFDISGLDDFSPMTNTADQSFDFFDHQATGFQLGRSSGNSPYVADQYGLDQWASAQGGDLGVSHTRPHHSISSQDSGQLDSSWFESSFQSAESPQGMTSFAENFWPGSSVAHPQIAQSSSTSLPSAEADWSGLESGTISSSGGELSSSMNRRERRNIARLERARNAAIQQLVDSIPSVHAGESRAILDAFDVQRPVDSSSASPTDSLLDQSPSLGATSGGSLEYWGLENTRAIVAQATQALKSAPAAYQPIYEELQRLRGALEVIRSGDTEGTPVLRQEIVSEIEMLTSQLQVMLTRIKLTLRNGRLLHERHNRLDPEFHPDFLKQSSGETRRLISALCTTINSLQNQDTRNGGSVPTTNTAIISSGNVLLAVSPNSPTQSHPQDSPIYSPSGSYLNVSSSSLSIQDSQINRGVIRPPVGKNVILGVDEDVHREGDLSFAIPGANSSETVSIATIGKVPCYSLVTKPALERLSRLVDVEDSAPVEVGISPQIEHVHALASHVAVPPSLPLVISNINGFVARSELTSPHNPPNQAQPFPEVFSRSSQTTLTNPLIINPAILYERDQPFKLQLVSNLLAASSQNIGSSEGESLQHQSASSSPGAIPGILLESNGTSCSNSFARSTDLATGFASYLVLLTSLVLLNYLQATTFMLPLAALFLAMPRPTPAIVASMAFAIVVAQSLPLSPLISGLKYLVSAGFMLAPLFKTPSSDSFGRVLNLSKRSSTPLANYKDPSLVAMFNVRSLGRSLNAI